MDQPLQWRKASASATDNCVEVGFAGPDDIRVRDSKNRDDGVLQYTRGEWEAFLGGVKDGEFDR